MRESGGIRGKRKYRVRNRCGCRGGREVFMLIVNWYWGLVDSWIYGFRD